MNQNGVNKLYRLSFREFSKIIVIYKGGDVVFATKAKANYHLF